MGLAGIYAVGRRLHHFANQSTLIRNWLTQLDCKLADLALTFVLIGVMQGLFIVQGLDSPSTRYRVLQYIPYLEAHGVDCKFVPSPKTFLQRVGLFRKMRQFDFVFIQRKRFGPFATWCLRRKSNALAFDFDDAVMFHDSQSETQESSSRQRHFVRAVRAADLVFCGNEFIRDVAGKHNSNTVLLPTVIDTQRYPQKQYVNNPKITLGWIGSRSTLAYLKRLRPVFERIGCRRDNIELKIVCDTFFDLQNMPVQKVDWNNATEVAEVQSFDIGLMPLADDVWSKGKCGLKLLQCHAAGVPVVASPVGVNSTLVEEGVTGLRAITDEEWFEKILRLADDPVGRERMGREGQRRVVETYSVQKQGPVLLEHLRNLLKQRKKERGESVLKTPAYASRSTVRC